MRVVKGSGDGVKWIETIFTDTIPMTKEQRISRWKNLRRKTLINVVKEKADDQTKK